MQISEKNYYQITFYCPKKKNKQFSCEKWVISQTFRIFFSFLCRSFPFSQIDHLWVYRYKLINQFTFRFFQWLISQYVFFLRAANCCPRIHTLACGAFFSRVRLDHKLSHSPSHIMAHTHAYAYTQTLTKDMWNFCSTFSFFFCFHANVFD